jgi:hypothetical protein
MGTHEPTRPTWRCVECGLDWPCPSARRRMSVDYYHSRTALGLYLTAYMFDAMRDLRLLPAGEMYERFIGWIHTGESFESPR